MKKHTPRVSLRHLLALLAITVGAVAIAGCAVEPESTDSDELASSVDDGPEASPQSSCCQEGTVTCTVTGNQWIYTPPAPAYCSNGRTRLQALNLCKSTCGNHCVDSGWGPCE